MFTSPDIPYSRHEGVEWQVSHTTTDVTASTAVSNAVVRHFPSRPATFGGKDSMTVTCVG